MAPGRFTWCNLHNDIIVMSLISVCRYLSYIPDSLVQRVVTIFITSISAYGVLALAWQPSSTKYCNSFPGELDLYREMGN